MVERLSKGKTLAVVLIIGFVALSIAVFTALELFAAIMFVVSAAFLVLFLLVLVTWLKKNAGIQKANFHELTQSVKTLGFKQNEQFASATMNSKALESRLSNLEHTLNQKQLSSAMNQAGGESPMGASSVQPREVSKNLYAPGALPSAKVIKSNTPGAVGRRAASMETETPGFSNFDIILNSEKTRWTKKVATIVQPETMRNLAEKHDVVALRPNQTASVVEEEVNYIVIDEHCSRSGQWAGFLETFKLGTYLELADSLKRAKRRGAIVIVIQDPISSSLTNSVRDFADICLNLNSPEETSRFESIDLFRDVREFAALEGSSNV